MAIREKIWTCSECEASVLGRHKDCPQCGSPREKGEMRSLVGQGSVTVTDPELLKLANAGADWFCTHCSAGNIGNGDRCSKCGADRYDVAEEDHPDFKRPPPPKRPLEEPLPTTPSAPDTRMKGGLFGVVILVLLGFVFWAMQTHEVEGSVTSTTWTRTVHVESWVNTTTHLFRKDTAERPEVQPRRGSGERAGLALIPNTCRDEYYKTIQVECGSHEECEDVYRTEQESYACSKTVSEDYACSVPGPDVACGEDCQDLGNGFEDCHTRYCPGPEVPGTCSHYVQVSDTCTRDVEVFDHKACRTVTDYCDKKLDELACDYRTQAWAPAGDHASSGSGKDLFWKDVSVGPLQRASFSATTRRVISYGDGETKEYVTKVDRTDQVTAESSAAEYRTWAVGDRVVLDVNNLGGIAGEPRRVGAR